MALDNFKRTDIIIDTAGGTLDEFTPLKANVGEYNGRYLRVQLTNGGIVEPQTADVHFGFWNPLTDVRGYMVAKKTDPSKGIYDIFYPSEMLTDEGLVICQLKLIEVRGSEKKEITLLDAFKVEVGFSIITNQMEVVENSITVFDKILLDIKEHERRVILLETAFADLFRLLNTNIPNMDAPVSSRASQSSLNTLTSNVGTVNQTANSIYSKLNQGMVKRVQRGLIVERSNPTYSTLSGGDTGTGVGRYYKDVTLPYSVNTSKAVAFLEAGGFTSYSSGEGSYICQLLNSSTLRIISVNDRASLSGYPVFSWQVIEYY